MNNNRSVSDYVSLVDFAKQHGYSDRGIYLAKLCRAGKIDGAVKIGKRWIIPADTELSDHRLKTGQYIGWRKNSGAKVPYPKIRKDADVGPESPE